MGAALLAAAWGHVDLVPQSLNIAWWGPLVYGGIVAGYHWLRALRWYFLLRPFSEIRRAEASAVAYVGFLWITLLPLRLGEAIRPTLLMKYHDVGLGRAAGTIVVERVVDAVIICALFLSANLYKPWRPGSDTEPLEQLISGTNLLAGALLLAVAVIVALALRPGLFGRLVAIPFGAKLGHLGRELAEGMASLATPRWLAAFVLTTLAYWGLNALGIWFLAHACGLQLSLAQSAVLMALLGLMLLLPSAPAQAGPFQLGIVFGLKLFVTHEELATAGSVFVFLCYFCQLTVTTLYGLYGHARLRFRWGWPSSTGD
ncbi:MAG: lysylphosphatidylglycerol synthase transmembrane domain-containing protein [Nannocystaceae bacterium]